MKRWIARVEYESVDEEQLQTVIVYEKGVTEKEVKEEQKGKVHARSYVYE